MPSRIFLKLLASLLTSFSLLVLIIFFVINFSFQQGFISYLQQKDLRLVEEMTPFLVRHYQEQKNWRLLYQNHRIWNDALRSASIPLPPPPGRKPPGGGLYRPVPIDESTLKHLARPGREAHSSRTLAMRISLYDLENKLIFGIAAVAGEGSWVNVNAEGKPVAKLFLRGLDLKDDQLANSFIDHQQQNLIYIGVAVLLLSLLLAAVWAKFLLRPINRLIRGVQRLAAGEYSVRVEAVGSDELTLLANHFNEMASSLERNEQLRGQWLADISHELRTPVTVIRGEIEALLDGVREPTIERIRSLFDETNALTALIEDLHLLSLADNDALKLELENCSLHNIIQHQIRLFKLRAEQKGLRLDFNNQLLDPAIVSVDKRRISQVLNNLLENSLRYTDATGRIEVVLAENSCGDFTLSVCDTKPGVSDSDLKKIFDRLYCVDKSRSRSVGGSGLGLSICKSIVQAHKGEIVASHCEEGGLCIQVRFQAVTAGAVKET